MRKKLCFTVALLWIMGVSFAQTIKTVGATGTDYATLKTAFDAINAGTLTGAVELQIKDNITETDSARLVASGTGAASYTSVTIYPTVAGKSITGNLAKPMIILDGADNVTIDGRVNKTGTAVDLVIDNTNINGIGINLINGATNNTIQYATLKAASTTTTSSIIYIGASTVAGGNSNNTISNNYFTGSTTRPLSAIASKGTAAPNDNLSNTIDNNRFYNLMYLPAGGSIDYKTINIDSNCSAWTISNNRFYETDTLKSTSTPKAYFIYINTKNTGTSFVVSGNNIGGKDANGSGKLSIAINNSVWQNGLTCIYINSDTLNPSSIQGNIIKNIYYETAMGDMSGIYIDGKTSADVGTIIGNIIGSTTENGSVIFKLNTVAGYYTGYLTAIFDMSTKGVVRINNNTIAGLVVDAFDDKIGPGLSCIQVSGLFGSGTTGTVYIDNNLIGSELAKSLEVVKKSTTAGTFALGITVFVRTGTSYITNNTVQQISHPGSHTIGIFIAENSISWIRNNTVRNLYTAYNSGSVNNATGITHSYGNGAVSGNKVYGLKHTGPACEIWGISCGGIGNNVISDTNGVYNNFIADIHIRDTISVNAKIIGLNTQVPARNNIISINDTSSARIYGIYGASPTDIWNNTVYISGVQTFGKMYTYALYIKPATFLLQPDFDIRNNLLVNTRTRAANAVLPADASKHFAIGIEDYYKYKKFVIDYNEYYATGTGGFLGLYLPYAGGQDSVYSDLNTWRTYTKQDCHSYNENPGLANPQVGKSPTDFLPANDSLSGYPFIRTLTGTPEVKLLKDYFGNTRGRMPLAPMSTGAIEYATYPRKGFIAPYLNSVTANNKVITINGERMGEIDSLMIANAAGPGYTKIKKLTRINDTSASFILPDSIKWTKMLLDMTLVICGGKTQYNERFLGDTIPLNLVPQPTISLTGTIANFSYCEGLVSISKNIKVSGNLLTNDVTITAPVGFEIKKSTDASYSSSIVLPQTAGILDTTIIDVRVTATATGALSDSLSFVSSGTPTVKTKLIGTPTTKITPSVIIISSDADTSICEGGKITFSATPTNGGTPTYQWQVNGVAVKDSTGATFTTTTLVNGDKVKVVMPSTETCVTSATATSNEIPVTVISATGNAPTVTSDDADNTICIGTKVTFTATSPLTSPSFQWQLNGVDISTATGTTYATTTLNTGDKVRVYTTGGAGCPVYSSDITTTVNAIPTVTATPATIVVNLGDSTVLTASGATTYTWTPNTGVISTSGATIVVKPLDTTTYSVSGSSNNCGSEAVSVQVMVDKSPKNLKYISPVLLTNGIASPLIIPTVSGAATIKYSISGVLPAGLKFDTTTGIISGTPTVAQPTPVTYTVTATNAYGSISTTLDISVADVPPVINYTQPTERVYPGTTIKILTPTLQGSPAKKFSISPGLPAGLVFDTTTGIISGTLTGNVSGTVTYTITASNDAGSSSATVTIDYSIIPTINNFKDTTVKYGIPDNTITPPTSNSPGTFTYVSSNPSVVTIIGNQIIIKGVGTAVITATQAATGNYTAASISKTITVIETDELFIEPSIIFSPNGDGVNDKFVIKNLDKYPDNKLTVFDRTGKILYEKEMYNNEWNGQVSNGSSLTKDTYFYILTIKRRVVKKGTISVVK